MKKRNEVYGVDDFIEKELQNMCPDRKRKVVIRIIRKMVLLIEMLDGKTLFGNAEWIEMMTIIKYL